MILTRQQKVLRILKAVAVALASLFFAAAIGLLWVLRTGRAHPFIRRELTEQLKNACDVDLAIESLEIGIFPPELYVKQLGLRYHDTNLLSVEEVKAGVAYLPLFYGRLQLERVSLLGPAATLELEQGKPKDLPKCLTSSSAAPAKPTPSSGFFSLGIRDLVIERADFRVENRDGISAHVDTLDFQLSPAPSGGSDFALGVKAITLEPKDSPVVPFGDLRFLGHVAGPLTHPRAVSLRSGALDLLDAHLGVTGSLDLVGPVAEARARLQAPLSLVNKLVPDTPELAGNVDLSLSFAGDFVHPRVAGTLVATGAKVDTFSISDELKADLKADSQRLDVTHFSAKYGPGEIAGNASIRFDDAFTLTGETVWSEVSLGRFVESMGFDGPWVDHRASGKVSISGPLNSPYLSAQVDLNIKEFRVFDRAFDRPEIRKHTPPESVWLAIDRGKIDAKVIIESSRITVPEVSIRSDASHLQGNARFEFSGSMEVDAVIDPFDFRDVGSSVATLPILGHGRLAARVGGPFSDLGAQGTFDLSDVEISDIPFGSGKGKLSWTGTTLVFEDIEGKLISSPYKGAVTVELTRGPELGISGELLGARVEDLLVPFRVDPASIGNPKGEVSGRVELVGPARKLTGPLPLELRNLTVLGEQAEAASIDARLEAGAVIIENFAIRKHDARILGRLQYEPANGRYAFEARTREAPLLSIDALSQSTKQLTGNLDLTLSVASSGHTQTGTLSLGLRDLFVADHAIGGGQLFGRIRDGKLDVIGAFLEDDALHLEGSASLATSLPFNAQLRLRDFDVPAALAALNGVESRRVTGRVTASAALRGRLVDWLDAVGTVDLDRAKVTIRRADLPADSTDRGLTIETSAPARFELSQRSLETSSLKLLGPSSRLDVAGVFGGGRTNLGVEGKIDLALASSLFAPVQESAGLLSLEATIRARDDDYDLVGTGRLERGLLEWRNLPGRLTGVTSNVVFSQATILLEDLEGRYEGGRVAGSGQLFLDGAHLGSMLLELGLDRVRPQFVYPTFDLEGTLSGNLSLEGTMERLALRGEVEVERGAVRPKFEWRDMVDQAQNRLLPKVYDPASEILDLDVAVRPKDPVRLQNGDMADLQLGGDVRLVGTNQRMGLLGSMNALSGGHVGFLNRDYMVRGGTVDFRDQDRFFPRYDVDLSAVACDHEIALNLVGTLDGNTITYSSKPEMSQSDIVACLFGGARIKDLEDAGDEAAASIAGQLLVEVTGVERQVKRLIPVDQIELTSEYSSRERLYEPRLLVAKEILDGKVRLEYSSSLLRQDDQRAAMRYRVSQELTLKGGWTSSEEIPIGDVGVDVSYRWEF